MTPFAFTGELRDGSGLQYHRARYYVPRLGVFPSLDPFEGNAETPMTLNGYAYTSGDPVNFADPTGMCEQPTQWWNPIDANCYYSAVGLAQRYSQGNTATYHAWFNYFMQFSWLELKSIEARQSLDDAAIIPRLFRDNPAAALQALEIYACQNQGTIQGLTAAAVIATASTTLQLGSGTPAGTGGAGGGFGIGGVLTAVVGGVAVAVIGLIIWDEFSRQPLESRRTVSELKNRMETIAEHLAKLLGEPVAGYPPSGPNPNRDPDAGWCETIQRSIEAIDNLGLSRNQFDRDFGNTGLGDKFLNEVKEALKKLKNAGWCNDDWDDFDGGSLASS